MSETDDSIPQAINQGMLDALHRFRFGGNNDNLPSDHPYPLMLAAQDRYVKAKSLAAGVRHMLTCAKKLNKPGSFAQSGAVEIISLCEELLAALKARADADEIGHISLQLGVAWGQLRTRASA